MELTPYISFDGTCAEAFAFYAGVLGGELEYQMTYGESPMAAETPAEQHGRVLHASLRFGDRRLLGADAPPPYFAKPQGFCVSISFDDTEKARAAFTALSVDGKVQMEFGPTFWTSGFGMLIDRFGTPWMVNGAPAEMPS